MDGTVRGILLRHLGAHHPSLAPGLPPGADANSLVPAPPWIAALRRLEEAHGPAALRGLGQDYALLWARTFRTLVRHLDGRPEDMVAILAHEILPYLLGDRMSCRLEPGRAPAIRLAPGWTGPHGIPDAYLEGLFAGFLGLTRSNAHAQHAGAGLWHLTATPRPGARLGRLVRHVRMLRIPYLLAAAAGLLVAVAYAMRQPGAQPWHALAVVVGVLAAQLAANALPELTRAYAGPLARPAIPRTLVMTQALGGAVVAAASAAWLSWQRPVLVAFVMIGALIMAGYPWLRDRGFGPSAPAIAHGPLLSAGAVLAIVPTPDLMAAALLGVPVGLLSAALIHLGDLGDLPLDQAAGHRTLAVRLPRLRQGLVFSLLLGAGLLGALPILLAAAPTTLPWLAALALASLGALIIQRVLGGLDDPGRLAGARAATIFIHAATATLMAASIGATP